MTNKFKNYVSITGDFNSIWKQEAICGDYVLEGVSKSNEPFYCRNYNGKKIFVSLWGIGEKRKWRIGPDVSSKSMFQLMTIY